MSFERKLLAFHYVWYRTLYGPSGLWGAWTENGYNPDIIIRGQREIDAPHYPLDGPYDSLDPVVIRRQVDELQFARIDGSIVSWWGPGEFTDQVLDALVAHSEQAGHGITIYYESPMVSWRTQKANMSPNDLIYNDMKTLLERHGSKACWLKVDDRPLFVVYVVFTQPATVWHDVRARLRADGQDPFLLGDTGDAFDPQWLDVFDGVHTYNPVGFLIRGGDLASLYRRAAAEAHAKGKLFAGTVLPGYDDRKIRTPGINIPRGEGELYRRTWEASIQALADWIFVTSFNEWHEGSEIETSREYGKDYLYATRAFAEGWKKE